MTSEHTAFNSIIRAIEERRIDAVKSLTSRLGDKDVGKAYCWSLRVDEKSGELRPNDLEIIRLLALCAPQVVKDNLLNSQAGWVQIYIDQGDLSNATIFLDRVAANVAAGGNSDYAISGFSTVSDLAINLEQRGYPQLSESIAFGKQLASIWSVTANEIPLSGYDKIYKTLQGQSGNHERVLMEFNL